jgi:hypothetical protein
MPEGRKQEISWPQDFTNSVSMTPQRTFNFNDGTDDVVREFLDPSPHL